MAPSVAVVEQANQLQPARQQAQKHTALMQVPGHVASQSTRHHGWAPPAQPTAVPNGTHSRHSHKASRQHCQTVRAIHIDRRQHLELAWKRQQERDGESTLPAWHEDGQVPAAAQLIAPSCSSCRAAQAGCCIRQGDGDPGPAAPGGSCGQGRQLAAGGVLLHALLWGLQGAAAGLHLSVRGGEQQDNMQHTSQPAAVSKVEVLWRLGKQKLPASLAARVQKCCPAQRCASRSVPCCCVLCRPSRRRSVLCLRATT